MPPAADDPTADAGTAPALRRPGRWMRRIGLVLVLLVVLALAALWIGRERLADRLIADYLEGAGVPATYTVEEIGPYRQVVSNLVIGDPARPDLTVERLEIAVSPRLGLPDVARVRLVRPRLYGTLVGGKLSFGALDPLVFTGSKEPFSLPDIALTVEDGRSLIEGDYGPLGIRFSGSGPLRDGFAGELAAVAPRFAAGGCSAADATLYGRVEVDNAHPRFAGPVRLASLACPLLGIASGPSNVALDLAAATPRVDRVEGKAVADIARLALPGASAQAMDGTLAFSVNFGSGGGSRSGPAFAVDYDLEGRGLASGEARLAQLGLEGTVRAQRDFARVDASGSVTGRSLAPGPQLDRSLASAAQAAQGTLAAPFLLQARKSLAAQLPGSTLAGEYDLRLRQGRWSLSVPAAQLRNPRGTTLLSVSSLLYATGSGILPLVSGSFATGGEGLPQLAGTLEQRGAGPTRVRVAMAPWRAEGASLALPELALVQSRDGALGFSGMLLASGPLPGGTVEGLRLPLSGTVSPAGEVRAWPSCADVTFQRLRLANLSLDRRSLTLCPPRGGAIVAGGAGGLRVAAGMPRLALSGRLGETPIALAAGPVGLAWPGALNARQVAVTLGPPDTATSFAIADLSANIGADIAGSFSGTDVRLFAVPLDLVDAGGTWRYAGGRFEIGEAAFTLRDRQAPERFFPLVARGAGLSLQDNLILASAALHEPQSDRVVTEVQIRHDLSTGAGDADLAVVGLLFDKALQPDQLTDLAKGIVANVAGTVSGSGRIAWNAGGVTSEGRFTTDSLDLAAAFGPVKGVSGTVEFADLLSLTTRPGQQVRIASVNPGIEVTDGVLGFDLEGGTLLRLRGGRWPFLGGTLVLEPTEMRFGNAETRRYVLQIQGLEAARLIEQMELGNIAVTGTFDGTVPIVFDEDGNGRLEGGMLVSRAPGGNLSYVGQLTYEDMGAIPNFAFQALKSLDFRQMYVQMDGSLVGEIVTKVRLDGVSQGVDARRNILTRQVARLPIRLDVNVRAPFYSLIGTLRRTYDPSLIPDPRSLGLVDREGRAATTRPSGSQAPTIAPPVLPPQAPPPPAIQPSEREDRP